MMSRFLARLLMAVAVAVAGGVVAAHGQEYPGKPVRIVTTAAGGGSDFLLRLMVPGISTSLNQQVVVDNRAGSAAIPGQTVAGAAADGYTLLFIGSGFWTAALLEKMPYDPVRDFAPITLIGRAPNMLVVHPSLPVKTVRDLIELAKSRPGQLNAGTGIIGSSPHLAAELFRSIARIDIVCVPYKGPAPALVALLGGQVQLMFPTATAATPYIKTGRLRALAITSAEPSALAPGLPTMASSGLPGYESAATYGMFAPVKTPPALIARLNREVVGVITKPELKEKFLAHGVSLTGSSPEEFGAAIKSEMSVLGKLIKDAGIRGD